MKTGRMLVLVMALCLGQLAGAQELTDAQKAAAEAAKLAAEKQAVLDASILEQAKLLAEIRDLMKNKS